MTQLDRIEDMLARLCAHLGCVLPEDISVADKPAKETKATKKKDGRDEAVAAVAAQVDDKVVAAAKEVADTPVPTTKEALNPVLIGLAHDLGDDGPAIVRATIGEYAEGGTGLGNVPVAKYGELLAALRAKVAAKK